MDYGIRVVISPRFADIFRGNSGKGGLLAAEVTQDDVELLWKLLENEPGTEVTVDLEQQTISAGSLVIGFQIDPYIRWRLLEGWDDISLTLRHADEINEFESVGRPSRRSPDEPRIRAGRIGLATRPVCRTTVSAESGDSRAREPFAGARQAR